MIDERDWNSDNDIKKKKVKALSDTQPSATPPVKQRIKKRQFLRWEFIK